MVTRGRSTDSPVLPSAEQLLKPRFEHLQVITLQLLRKALDVQDQLVSLVEQLFADLLLHPVFPGTQLRVALKHIQASSNRLRNRIRLELTSTSLLICAYFKFAISHFPMNLNIDFYQGIYFPSAVFMFLSLLPAWFQQQPPGQPGRFGCPRWTVCPAGNASPAGWVTASDPPRRHPSSPLAPPSPSWAETEPDQ